MNKQISQAIGWAVGVLIVFPLIIYGVNNLFKKKDNNSKSAIPIYIDNCVELRISFPDQLDFRDTQYKTSLLSPEESIYKIFFKEKSMKKYLEIAFFNYPDDKGLAFPTSLRGKKIIVTINKNDLDDPNYGTPDNPIPIFRVREDLPDSISKTRGSEDGWNVDITENQFKYNVEQYLTYIMPNEELKERFEKGK